MKWISNVRPSVHLSTKSSILVKFGMQVDVDE